MAPGYELVELPAGAGVDGPYGWIHEGLAAVSRTDVQRTYGDADLVESAAGYAALLADTSRYVHYRAVVASTEAPTTAVAHASVDLPTVDGADAAEFGLLVDAAHRGRGLGRRLYDWASSIALAAGRTSWVTWLDVPPQRPGQSPADPWPDPAIPDAHAGWGFARARGWQFEVLTRLFVLNLPTRPHAGPDQAGAPVPGYRLETWPDGIPPRWRGGYAALMGQPWEQATGGIDSNEGAWDEQRVLDEARSAADRGQTELWIGAIHEPDETLAGVANVGFPGPASAHAFLGATEPGPDHRGRGLTRWLMAAGLAELARLRPDLRRVYTWGIPDHPETVEAAAALGYVVAGASATLTRQVAPDVG